MPLQEVEVLVDVLDQPELPGQEVDGPDAAGCDAPGPARRSRSGYWRRPSSARCRSTPGLFSMRRRIRRLRRFNWRWTLAFTRKPPGGERSRGVKYLDCSPKPGGFRAFRPRSASDYAWLRASRAASILERMRKSARRKPGVRWDSVSRRQVQGPARLHRSLDAFARAFPTSTSALTGRAIACRPQLGLIVRVYLSYYRFNFLLSNEPRSCAFYGKIS